MLLSRPRVFIRHELPSEVVGVAIAVIADYERRAREIKRGVLSEHLLSAYRRYQGIVDSALECVEPEARRELISDIASGRGYNHSMLSTSYYKAGYYSRKRQVIYSVAKGMGLCE